MNRQLGMTLVELLIAMIIGVTLLLGAAAVMSSNNRSLQLNEALGSVQENGRFALSKLSNQLRYTGFYDQQAPELNTSDINVAIEAADVIDNAVVFPGAYAANLTLGSSNGSSNGSDTLVVAMASDADCSRDDHGYGTVVVAGETINQTFHVVNEYFLQDNELRCRGYEGRVLRGDKSSSGSSNSVALVENVEDFQVLYGVAQPDANGVFTGQPAAYLTADDAANAVTAGGRIVAIQIALMLFSEEEIASIQPKEFKLLDTATQMPTDNRIYRVFERTVLIRNLWNAVVFGGISS